MIRVHNIYNNIACSTNKVNFANNNKDHQTTDSKANDVDTILLMTALICVINNVNYCRVDIIILSRATIF